MLSQTFDFCVKFGSWSNENDIDNISKKLYFKKNRFSFPHSKGRTAPKNFIVTS